MLLVKTLPVPVFFVGRAKKKTQTRMRKTGNVRVKDIVYKIHDRCSNPLYKDTKECIAYWNAITTFNKEIDHIHTTMSLNESGETFPLTETLCDDDTNAHMEKCRVYDL